MNKKKYIKIIILIFLVIISNVLTFNCFNLDGKNITLSYKVISDRTDTYQLFYGNNTLWTEQQSEKVSYTNVNKQETIKFTIPKNTTELRFDMGNKTSNVKISDIRLSYLGRSVDLDVKQILNKKNQYQISKINQMKNYIVVETIGNDPYITYKIDSSTVKSLFQNKNIINNILKFVLCIVIDVLILILFKNLNSINSLFQELNNNKRLIWNLAKNDFKTKYAGSYLGIFWAFVQPIITVLTYWFVFQVGFRSAPMNNFPFLLWLVVGLVPWFFFAEGIINATNAMIEYSYLVKKVVFKISILPIVKIVSAFFVHMFFIIFTIVLFTIYGYPPTIYVVQILYYTLCTFILVLGISYATSAVIVFFKDLGQIVAIVLQVGVWFTPIMWSYNMIPSKYQWIFKLNPMYYVVEGYRDSFINHVWMLHRYNQTIYFWGVAIILFVVGSSMFRKLKVHFADVL